MITESDKMYMKLALEESQNANCAKLLINAGIKKVFYNNNYSDEETFKILKEAGVETIYCEI